MSDIADRADQVIAFELVISLAAVRKSHTVAPDGHCCFCDEAVPYPSRFCNIDCQDDYDREQATLRRAGKSFG